MVKVYGHLLDGETRCIHYHSELDIVALKCFACKRYYACYQCHNADEEHVYLAYPISLSKDVVVLCGHCQSELTISQYQLSSACPLCNHNFNPGCKAHAAIYFQK